MVPVSIPHHKYESQCSDLNHRQANPPMTVSRIARRRFLTGTAATAAFGVTVTALAKLGDNISLPTPDRSLGIAASDSVGKPLAQGWLQGVTIEDNGWVLCVEGYWPASTFANFSLDAGGQPKVALHVVSAGFERFSSTARAADRSRIVVATKPLRLSVAIPILDLKSLDETHADGGLRKVRLGLSEPIHKGDTITSVHFAESWREGLAYQATRSITNRSIFSVEEPSMRWAIPTMMRVTEDGEDFTLDLLVASGWAEGLAAVAAVRIAATDGVFTNERWLTAARKSEGWGDQLKCWNVSAKEICRGLNRGPVTVHADVFPWIGAMRSTGKGHSRSHLDGLAFSAQKPVHVVWDPLGTHMPEAHVYVEPNRGSSNPALVTVGNSLFSAKLGIAASNPSVAAQAIWLANRRIPAANSWPESTRAGDNAIITIAPGVHGFGALATSAGASCNQGRMIIQGDPDSYDPTVECNLEVGQRPLWRYDRLLFRNLCQRIGGSLMPNSTAICHFHNVQGIARLGFEENPSGLFTNSGDVLRNTITGSLWWKSRVSLRGSNMRFGLIRGCRVSRTISAPVMVGNIRVDDGSSNFYLEGLSVSGSPELASDQFVWGNQAFGAKSTLLAFPTFPASDNPNVSVLRRFRMVNNLFESIQGNSQPMAQFGEGRFARAEYCLIEGNTLVGQRLNWAYNDPPSGDIRLQNQHTGNFVRNNCFDWLPTKHDAFKSPRYGHRPGFTGCWSILYGVGYRDNVMVNRGDAFGNAPYEYYGVGSLVSPYTGPVQANIWIGFERDRSQYGTVHGKLGYGRYMPQGHSPLRLKASRACIDVDVLGRPRIERFAAGAFEESRNSM